MVVWPEADAIGILRWLVGAAFLAGPQVRGEVLEQWFGPFPLLFQTSPRTCDRAQIMVRTNVTCPHQTVKTTALGVLVTDFPVGVGSQM